MAFLVRQHPRFRMIYHLCYHHRVVASFRYGSNTITSMMAIPHSDSKVIVEGNSHCLLATLQYHHQEKIYGFINYDQKGLIPFFDYQRMIKQNRDYERFNHFVINRDHDSLLITGDDMEGIVISNRDCPTITVTADITHQWTSQEVTFRDRNVITRLRYDGAVILNVPIGIAPRPFTSNDQLSLH